MIDDMLNVAPRLHYNLRHAINWKEWLNRRKWTKQQLLSHMNKCDLKVDSIRIHEGKEQVGHIVNSVMYWMPIESEGSGFNALYAGIFKDVLGEK